MPKYCGICKIRKPYPLMETCGTCNQGEMLLELWGGDWRTWLYANAKDRDEINRFFNALCEMLAKSHFSKNKRKTFEKYKEISAKRYRVQELMKRFLELNRKLA